MRKGRGGKAWMQQPGNRRVEKGGRRKDVHEICSLYRA